MMPEISAREAFDAYQLIATALSGDIDGKKDYLIHLADQAFRHNEELYVKVISSIAHMGIGNPIG